MDFPPGKIHAPPIYIPPGCPASRSALITPARLQHESPWAQSSRGVCDGVIVLVCSFEYGSWRSWRPPAWCGVSASLVPPESLMLLSLASPSTLVPTAPGYVGAFQLLFAHVFSVFGYQQKTGIIAASAVQVFCGIVLASRSGLTIWRARNWAPHERP